MRLIGVTILIAVPSGYVSDSPLSDTATYARPDLQRPSARRPASTNGRGAAGANQNFTLDIGVPVPEPAALGHCC